MEQFKRAQVIMLPHNNINTTITKYIGNNTLSLNTDILAAHTNQHLYIISDDEIKEGDWKYNSKLNCINQHNREDKNLPNELLKAATWCKKIIATTDSSLTEPVKYYDDGTPVTFNTYKSLPKPSQQFIEKYIESYNKGEVITDILVEYEKATYNKWFENGGQTVFDKFKINQDNTINIKPIKDVWTLEEMHKLMDDYQDYLFKTNDPVKTFKEWFNL